MLNINQNFDLKAPVFNFDRDYFNSVEELNAYDTSNVPNYFVTNVAGMLYQFTDGKWFPMIGTDYDDALHYVDLGCINARLEIDTQNSEPSRLWLSNTSGYSTLSPTSLNITNFDPIGGVSIEADYNGSGAGITVSGDSTSNTIVTDNKIICGDDSFKVDIYGDEGRMEINDAQGRFTNYSASGFSVQTKNDTKSIKLDIDDTEADERYGSTVNVSLTHDEYQVNINALDGFRHSDSNGSHSNLYSSGLYIGDGINRFYIHANQMTINNEIGDFVSIGTLDGKHDQITLGTDHKFKISCPTDNTEGATITGIKSLTAFANPSATKVWATDGSTINMPTKFSDLTNDNVYITGNKGETDARFKIDYKDGDVLRSRLIYRPRNKSVGISELSMLAYDTSGTALSQIRIRPDNNADDGQYVIQVQDVKGGKQINCVSTLRPEAFINQNFVDNTCVELNSNELNFYNYPDNVDANQIQLKINKEGITKTNGKATEVFAANGSIIDLTNYFNSTTTVDKLKSKAVEVTDATNSVIVSPTGITATNGSATKVFATDGSTVDLSTKANASDVLLKKNVNGGYYIESNSNMLGHKAFAANSACTSGGNYSFAEGYGTQAQGDYSHAEGGYTRAVGVRTHAEGEYTLASGAYSHTEGIRSKATGYCTHAEGSYTEAVGFGAHAQGAYNIVNKNAIHSVGIGNATTRKNAEYIYAKNNEKDPGLADDPKNGYKYLIGVGGYDGISTDNTTYKSVQEVIADLTARIEQLEKLIVNSVSISNVDEQTNQ